MAKTSYKIPHSLNASYGDMVISLKSNDGIGVKPTPIKVILGYLASVVALFMVMTKTFISAGSLGQKGLFIIGWVLMTVLLLRHDGTGRMQLELIPTLFNYVRKSDRLVITRTSAGPEAFYGIANVKSVTKNGLVEFTDGTFGNFYRVVGSASILLFEADRRAILDRVDSFYRKLNTDCEVCFITTKAAQTVYKQINALKRKYDRLEVRDPELLALAEAQFRCLKNYVGSSFKSIHQYMLIKADNREMLAQTKNVLQSEVENSTLMIKRCIPMYEQDILLFLETIYKGKGR